MNDRGCMVSNTRGQLLDSFLYVFWAYDQYPYFLHGQATRIDENGLYYVDSYQRWIKTCNVLPLDRGRLLANKLDELKRDYREQKVELGKKFKQLLDEEVDGLIE